MVPWRTEGAVYTAGLGDVLPDGLSTPRALGVHAIDEGAYTVWLEVVPTAEVTWDLARYRRAAGLLGRFAGRPGRSATLADVEAASPWDISAYVEGRLGHEVLPVLGDPGVAAPAPSPGRSGTCAHGCSRPSTGCPP